MINLLNVLILVQWEIFLKALKYSQKEKLRLMNICLSTSFQMIEIMINLKIKCIGKIEFQQ